MYYFISVTNLQKNTEKLWDFYKFLCICFKCFFLDINQKKVFFVLLTPIQ